VIILDTHMFSVTWPPNVLGMHAEGFLEGLRETGFSDLVRGLRKRRVHGVT